MSKLSNSKIASILDRITEGGGYDKIAEDVKCSPATIMKLVKDYPLWAYLRKPKDFHYD